MTTQNALFNAQTLCVRSACSGGFCGLSTMADWESIETLYCRPWRVQQRIDLGEGHHLSGQWLDGPRFGRLADADAHLDTRQMHPAVEYRLLFDPSRPYVEAHSADIDTPLRRAHVLTTSEGAVSLTAEDAQAAMIAALIGFGPDPRAIKHIRDHKAPPVPTDTEPICLG